MKMVKRLPAMRETRVRSLDWEDLLEKEMATHSSVLAWRIPRTEGYSLWGHKESDFTYEDQTPTIVPHQCTHTIALNLC